MRIGARQSRKPSAGGGAFTIVEVVFAMGTPALMFLALYAGLTWGFTIMRLCRENTRATQILLEKMETVRLYTWDQVNTEGFLTPAFDVPYYPMGGTNAGTIYHGSVVIGPAPVYTSYADDMRIVTVTVNWKTGDLPRTRSISTYVSRYGLQNYVYF
jgi:hypothetical protein